MKFLFGLLFSLAISRPVEEPSSALDLPYGGGEAENASTGAASEQLCPSELEAGGIEAIQEALRTLETTLEQVKAQANDGDIYAATKIVDLKTAIEEVNRALLNLKRGFCLTNLNGIMLGVIILRFVK